jgi:cytochrome c peroxidase
MVAPRRSPARIHALGFRGHDECRFKVTGVEADRYAFRTPTLRNVDLTAPYMHDGSVSTLRSVIDLYNAGGGQTVEVPCCCADCICPRRRNPIWWRFSSR